MKKRLLPFVLAGALTAAFAAPAAAQTSCVTDTTQRGGAAALASLISAAVNNVAVTVQACDINVLNDSLNNLLRNANIEVLNDSLNNLLRNANIEVVSIDGNVIQVNILSGGIVVDTLEITLIPA